MRIRLYIDNRPSKNGLFPVRISVSFHGERFLTSVGVSMNMQEFEALNAEWNGQKPNKKYCHQKHKDIIRLLADLEDSLLWEEQKIKRGEISKEDVDLPKIVNSIKGNNPKKESKDNSISVNSLFLEFIKSESKKKDLSDGTTDTLYIAMRKIISLNPKIELQEMAKPQWLHEFVETLVEQGLNNSSVKNLYVRTRWFLMWCYRNDYCDNSFTKYKLELKTVDVKDKLVVFLTMDEIRLMQNLKLDGQLCIARDFFLFLCFTGLRFSDASRPQKSDIKDGFVSVFTKKTGVFLRNKLNNYAIEIVNKYINSDGENLFPTAIFNCRINIQIREIAKMAGINEKVRKIEYRQHKREEIVVPKWQLLTTHVGRKSFVVNSLDMGLTANQVIAYTGHSTIQSMQPYISISNKKKDSAMDVWNELKDSE